jgi:hypothetical protein
MAALQCVDPPLAGADYSDGALPWDAALDEWRRAMQSLIGAVSAHARVTTNGSRGEQAHTVVPHSSDIRTSCSRHFDQEFAAGHARRVAAAIEERLLWMEAALVSAKVMNTLAQAYASPLTALAAARNAWLLVREIRGLVDRAGAV